jgi:hypothetical protein
MATSKAALQRLAAAVRAELGLADTDPFDPYLWSREYGVPFLALDALPISDAARDRFTRDAPELWSAALLRAGTGHVVVYNPAHSAVRVRSNLAHEAAHLVAEHQLTPTWLDPQGKCSGTTRAQEVEAAELAGALLVPADRARALAIRRTDPSIVAMQYDVSVDMARWRLDASGGAVIAQRYRAKATH